jgi:hypothetical protein
VWLKVDAKCGYRPTYPISERYYEVSVGASPSHAHNGAVVTALGTDVWT